MHKVCSPSLHMDAQTKIPTVKYIPQITLWYLNLWKEKYIRIQMKCFNKSITAAVWRFSSGNEIYSERSLMLTKDSQKLPNTLLPYQTGLDARMQMLIFIKITFTVSLRDTDANLTSEFILILTLLQSICIDPLDVFARYNIISEILQKLSTILLKIYSPLS